ncbi:3-epi-6-deoxocathasterone 23-monooxygenase [Phtheirospermum japonicum]|uniref:3-epi-6-deoxocathasterone 23-monooxygenase n=1 Tax=Phtheirospermum japonicum TaxID=374723 RepID=A0A830C5B3_9LAMI|nr:3-epi-6-deoxocathasterone 23-monooxygenase [Phtheirospermum japonicum]
MEWLGSEKWGFLVVLLLLSVLFLYKLWRLMMKSDQKMVKNEQGVFAVPRGSWGWPLIGETFEFIACGYTTKPVSFMEKRKSLYGDVFRTHILGKAIIVSTDPEVNKFKARITRDIEKSVKHSLSTWTDKSCRVYVQDETKKITFEILVRVLLSIGPGEEMELLKKEFVEFIKGLICLPINLPGTRLYKSLQAKKRLLKMVGKIVEERKMAMDKAEEKLLPNDAIDVLLRDEDSSDRLPLDFICGNIIEMMIPGEETVPTAMTLAVKFLVDNPVALAHLVEENMELKKKKVQSREKYSWTDYMSLPFTQNVISETLRLANIINAVWRKALKDVKIKGNLIPKGWCVLASFSSVHMDETNYENPYEFDPWRWKKIGNALSTNIFTPFGGGQRLCPGLELSRLEISIFLHHLVTTYRWAAEDDVIIYFPTVKMKRKLPITIMPLQ